MSASIAALAVELALKSTLLLAAVFVVTAAGRRLSAGERHGLWIAAFVGLLALPAVVLVAPALEVRLPERAGAAELALQWHGGSIFTGEELSDASVQARAVGADPVPARGQAGGVATAVEEVPAAGPAGSTRARAAFAARLVVVGYATIALLLLAYLVAVVAHVGRSARRLPAVSDAGALALLDEIRRGAGIRRDVQLKFSDTDDTPWAWGLRRPVVVVPREFLAWPEAARRSALLHEMAHIARGDFCTALLAWVCCALYWFQPLAWLAARRSSSEAEKACDDYVVRAGVRRSDYAAQLLELAGSLRRASRGRLCANAMTQRSMVSSRITSILNGNARRTTMGRMKSICALALIAMLVAPIGALKSQVHAESEDTFGDLDDPAFTALVARGPADGEELRRIVMTYLAHDRDEDAVAAITEYAWPYGYGVRLQAPPGRRDAYCDFCTTVLASIGRGAPHDALAAVLAALDSIEARATEANDGNPFLGLAMIARDSGPGPAAAGGKALWYLLEGFRIGNLADDSKMAAVRVLDALRMYEHARSLVEQLRSDPESSLYQSEELERWARFLDTRLGIIEHMGSRLLSGTGEDGEYLPVFRVAPVYPAAAAAAGLEGHVIVEFTVSERGRVRDVTVVESADPVFEEPAIEAAAQFLYAPRIVGNAPVEVRGVRNLFSFVLER